MTERSEKADHRSVSSYDNGKDARQCHCERTTTSRIPKQSHDLSRCTAFPLLYLIMYYCMLYHNRAKYTRGKFVCERCGNRAIGRRSKLGTRTSGGPLRLGSKHARASGGPFRPSAKDTRASAIPFRPGSKHFNQRTKMAQDFRVVRVSQTAAPPPLRCLVFHITSLTWGYSPYSDTLTNVMATYLGIAPNKSLTTRNYRPRIWRELAGARPPEAK